MTHKIQSKYDYTYMVVDEDSTEYEHRVAEPSFYTKFGKRNTYEFYRGFLINRHTAPHGRLTCVYAFGQWSDSTRKTSYCVANGSEGLKNSKQAKQLIDQIIESGHF